MRRISIIGVMALIICATALAPVSAYEAVYPPVKDNANDGKGIAATVVLNADGSVAIGNVKDVGSKGKLPKAVEIPESWKKINTNDNKMAPTDEDWAYIESAITDLSEKERKTLIAESRKIFEGTSKLSPDEQEKILVQLGPYIILATEDGMITPKWMNSSGHWQMSTAFGNQLGYITPGHVTILGDYAKWADDNRNEPTILEVFQNRHSWVLGLDVPLPYFDNYGPDSLEYYLNLARSDFSRYDVSSGYINAAKGLHFMEDLGCVFHTSSVAGQAHHLNYENWVSSHWSVLESATVVDTCYIINDPSEDSKYLAGYSHQYLQQICDIMNTAGWENSAELVEITRTLISETARMTMGMQIYATRFDSPNTVGANSVPIYDYQTSYAYVDNVACSELMHLPFYITHTYIGDLEIWLGCKDDSSGTYTEYKIWDRQGGSADNLGFSVIAQGFQNVHDWRFRVVDSAGGDEGYVEEFYTLVG